jgi:nickel/cobalt transporter (NicO) family protein
MGRRLHHRPALISAAAAVLALAVLPALALGHPLGNFTINHYAALRVEPDRVVVDLVIDQAEVPTFQATRQLDRNGDGAIDDEEASVGRTPTCEAMLADVRLTIDGVAKPLRLTDAGLSFPPGAGGLPTMRSVCVAEARLEPTLEPDQRTRIAFVDEAFAERLGWRELVVVGSGVTLAPVDPAAPLRTTSASARLTSYPEDQLAAPLAERSVEFVAKLGGPLLSAWSIPDAIPVAGAVPPGSPAAAAAAVPGGLVGDLPSIFRSTDTTPLVVLLALVTAVALGAGHALTPGHGKTLMAAYLVGTRGTVLHAVGLGLSVSLSHTAGILVLAAVVLGAADVVSPDVVVRTAPVVAALSIVAIGGWMLLGEWRRRRAAHTPARAHDHGHRHDEHGHPPEDHQHEPHEHRHGSGGAHSHAPAVGSTVTWRSLFALGLAGGLIPSTSALLILLGAIAAGRPAFGLVLVVAFGLGMAAVMAGIGVALVIARGRLEALPVGGSLRRLGAAVPLAAAVLVLGFGVWLTIGALATTPTL